MMQVSPFHFPECQEEADSRFDSELSQIKRSRAATSSYLIERLRGTGNISEAMRRTRQMSLRQRRDLYLEDRLRGQRTWYESNATENRSSSSRWFIVVTSLQAAALTFAVLKAAWLPLPVNFASLMMTMAASFTAWTQANKHEELANSYSLAAQELREMESLAKPSSDESEFQVFVENAEEAMSREHTMWYVRRNLAASHGQSVRS
jgi:hypothetical protein